MSEVKIAMIAAHAQHYGIGIGNAMPWHLPRDFQWFKEKTTGKVVIMGYNTHESIGKVLPNRLNIIVSRRHYDELKEKYRTQPMVSVFRDLAHAIKVAKTLTGEGEEIVVIGGANLYDQLLIWSDRLYITEVHAKPECDTFFPRYTASMTWETSFEEHHEAEGDKPAFTFRILERVFD